MLHVFDIDGTLCECWYGNSTPGFYTDETDCTIRSTTTNTYQFVNPLPYAQKFLKDIYDTEYTFGRKPQYAALSHIMNGTEFIHKQEFLQYNFLTPEKEPYFEKDAVYGVTGAAGKYIMLRALAIREQIETFYFDDNMHIIIDINRRQLEDAKNGKYPDCPFIFALHASSMALRTAAEIKMAYNSARRDFEKLLKKQ